MRVTQTGRCYKIFRSKKGLSLVGMFVALIFSALVLVVLFNAAATFYFHSVAAGHCPFMCKYREKWDYSAMEDTFKSPLEKPYISWTNMAGLTFGGPVGFLAGSFFEKDLGAVDRAKEWAIPQPSSTGCYCGVRKKTGKYIHAKMDPGNGEIWEFHLTSQPPATHNGYTVPDTIDHTSDCGNIGETWGTYTNKSGCLIFSVEKGDGCSLINVSTNVTIMGREDNTVKDEIEDGSKVIEGSGFGPLDNIKFGKKYKFRGKHRNPGYRALLEIPEAYPEDKKVGRFILWPANLTCTDIGERTVWTIEGKEALEMGV